MCVFFQASNDPSETTSKEKEKSEENQKGKDRKLDASQDKGSGWFGTLFGFKKSKQAVLPDDKNPTVSW